MVSFGEALTGGTVVLDGGLATELERRGNNLGGTLWSARLLAENPEEILAVHRAFFVAGAQVATTASYQASVEGFRSVGADPERMLTRSVELARRACDGQSRRWVAASVGPYGAVLADGSEYRGDYGLTVAELRRFHRPRLQVLAAAEPDVIAVETIPCLAEVEALVAELEDIDVPAWLSVTCTGTRTRAGEPASHAFTMAAQSNRVVAVGINCVDPDDVDELILLAMAVGKPIVVYPNSGETWDARIGTWSGSSKFSPENAGRWAMNGARGIGGCCRVTPHDINGITRAVGRTHTLRDG